MARNATKYVYRDEVPVISELVTAIMISIFCARPL
jgi:hypothetical protein